MSELRWSGHERLARTLRGIDSLEVAMVILGVILIILGLLVSSLSFLLWIGIILVIVGLILNLVPIGGTKRRYY